jgi:hypothetical protein
MRRTTRQGVDSFHHRAVTKLTNHPAGAAVRWVKASYRGFPTMINVVCYCGCAYSFQGDLGSCPTCGESVSFTRGSDAETPDRQETIAKILAQASGGSSPEELAA